MQYRTDPRSENRLSTLGFGCMRFPRTAIGRIDTQATEQLIRRAVDDGVNYFDTAYIYGESETVLGDILKRTGLRDRMFIATKLPIRVFDSLSQIDALFDEQLSHLQTDHIDYYFMHNLSEAKAWDRLCALGIEDWIARQKAAGRIGQVGFSFHGTQEEFFALLDRYDWDFCQIQYNYVNTHYQAGTAGLKRAAEKGLPVFIMEPLLGGKLATGLPKEAKAILHDAKPDWSPAEWSLRWLLDQPEVTVVLSGMNAMAQLEENTRVCTGAMPGSLTADDQAAIKRATEAFRATYKVACTGCGYCLPCPQKVNIPDCFAAYNMSYTVGRIAGFQQYVTSTGLGNEQKGFNAAKCVRCGKCEKKCPQHIPIMDSLEDVRHRMEPGWLRAGLTVFNRVSGRK